MKLLPLDFVHMVYKHPVIFTGEGAGEGVKVEAAGGNGFKHCCTFPTLSGIYR